MIDTTDPRLQRLVYMLESLKQVVEENEQEYDPDDEDEPIYFMESVRETINARKSDIEWIIQKTKEGQGT